MSTYKDRLKKLAAARSASVKKKRAAGKTWVEIGRELGITPQRAQQLGKLA